MKPEAKSQLRLILRAGGEFWNEAAVLVAVFSMLEKVLRLEGLPPMSWAFGTFLVAVLSFVLGVLFKIWGKE